MALWREASVPWVVIALVIYFFFYPCANKSTELKWVLLWTSLGVLMEFAFLKFSIIGYKDHSAFVPLWMVCLWVAFSATLNQSLSGLIQSKLLSFVLGAMGGPLSYWAAYRLEALYFPVSAERSLLILGVGWGLFLLFVSISRSFRKRKPGLRPVAPANR